MKFYLGAAANAAAWLLVLMSPLADLRTPTVAQGVPLLALAGYVLIGGGIVCTIVLTQVWNHPTLSTTMLAAFSLSMFAYTLVYWTAKCALTSVIVLPDPALWAIKALALVGVFVGLMKLKAKPQGRIVAFAAGLILVLAMSGLDLVLLGAIGAVAGLGTKLAPHTGLRSLSWALAVPTIVASGIAGWSMFGDGVGIAIRSAQAVVLLACVSVQAWNIHALKLLRQCVDAPEPGALALATDNSMEGIS